MEWAASNGYPYVSNCQHVSKRSEDFVPYRDSTETNTHRPHKTHALRLRHALHSLLRTTGVGWSSEQAKAELMALKPDRRLSSGGAGRASSAPSHTQRAAGGRRKQWDDNVAPPVPPRDERRSQLNPALPIHTKRATSHNTKPKGAFSSSVAEEYILAQKASALLEEEIARQAKLDAMVSQVTPPLGNTRTVSDNTVI